MFLISSRVNLHWIDTGSENFEVRLPIVFESYLSLSFSIIWIALPTNDPTPHEKHDHRALQR